MVSIPHTIFVYKTSALKALKENPVHLFTHKNYKQ